MSYRKKFLLSIFFFSFTLLPHFHLLRADTEQATTTLDMLSASSGIPSGTAQLLTASSTLTSTSTSAAHVHNAAEVEAKVRIAFSDAPVMISVARCESTFRQYADSGNVFRGGYGGEMVGIYQIYDSVHRVKALSMGFDIDTIDGNIGYAKYLYTQSGMSPWLSSFACWNDGIAENTTTGTTGTTASNQTTLTANLFLGEINPEVLTLQKILNASPFPIASSGPGSRGNETNKFGSLTRDAIRKFQCAQGIACSGDEYSTGFGYVGARTRAALLAYSQNNSVPAQPTTSVNPNPVTVATSQENPQNISALLAQIAELQKQVELLIAQLNALKTT